jgi:hypothetical protein
MTDDPFAAGMRRWTTARWVVPLLVFIGLIVVSAKVGAWRGDLVRDGALRFGVFMIPAIVFLVLGALRDVWKARVSRTWPTAPATVLSSRSWAEWAPYGFRDKAEVTLAFASDVPAAPFTYREDAMWPLGDWEELLRRYPAGATVSVPRSPADPNIVVLDPTGRHAKRELGLGMIVLAGCVGMLFLPGKL